MAWLGIEHEPCPKCGSTVTSEVHKPTLGLDSERELVVGAGKAAGERDVYGNGVGGEPDDITGRQVDII